MKCKYCQRHIYVRTGESLIPTCVTGYNELIETAEEAFKRRNDEEGIIRVLPGDSEVDREKHSWCDPLPFHFGGEEIE